MTESDMGPSPKDQIEIHKNLIHESSFLGQEHVVSFVKEYKYRFSSDTKNQARCIDGRPGESVNLEPLAKPGADLGDLMTMLATNNEYDLNLSPETIYMAFISTVGGIENVRIHTDEHNHHHEDKKHQCLGCGHFKHAALDPGSYGLKETDISFIFETLHELKSNGAQNEVLQGGHLEKAVIVLESDSHSISPKKREDEGTGIQCFVYHKTLDSERRRLLTKNLVIHANKEGLNEELLYSQLTTISDRQLLETVSRLAPNHPIYNVNIDEQGEVTLKD